MMSSAQAIDVFCLDTVNKLTAVKTGLQLLFLDVFRKPLTDAAWEHYYLNGPYGIATSFVVSSEGRLVAHGGVIPQQLVSPSGKIQRYFLQTGVMVAPQFRTLHIFQKLIDTIDAYVENQQTFVMAFPNQQSFSPLIRMMMWKQIRESGIRQYGVSNDGQGAASSLIEWFDDYECRLILDRKFLEWRSELNHMKVIQHGGAQIIYKDYEGSLEILDVQGRGFSFRELAAELRYQSINIAECFLSSGTLEGLTYRQNIGIQQRMCVYPEQIAGMNYQGIQPSILLSDVF